MLNAYQGLMKSAQQGVGGPRQSMGGTAQTVAWKDVPPVASGHIDDVLGQMDGLREKYANPNMDVTPQDAAHMSHLRQQLQHLHQWEQHGLDKSREQSNFRDEVDAVGQESDLMRALKRGGAGVIPPRSATPQR